MEAQRISHNQYRSLWGRFYGILATQQSEREGKERNLSAGSFIFLTLISLHLSMGVKPHISELCYQVLAEPCPRSHCTILYMSLATTGRTRATVSPIKLGLGAWATALPLVDGVRGLCWARWQLGGRKYWRCGRWSTAGDSGDIPVSTLLKPSRQMWTWEPGQACEVGSILEVRRL